MIAAIMIAFNRRVVWRSQSITKIPDRDHLLTSKLYGCNIMWPGVCRNSGNVMPAFTTYSRLRQENEGRQEWGGET